MEFRVLGPLEAVHDGQAIDLGPHKQRSLLALLLINANRVVSTDRILEEIWGEDAAGKENVLWVYISRLRSAFEPDREKRGESTVLLRRDHGYMLSIDPDSIDSHRFERKAEEGRALILDDPTTAATVLQEAADLWQGRAYEDFVYDDFAQGEIGRLEELRLSGVEGRIDADLRRGKAGELVSELEALCQDQPLKERLVAQLMLALYRAGRQAESLRTFERFRRHIGEELGIEPSPELRRLEEQVLLHDSRIQARRSTATRTDARSVGANPFKGLRAFFEDDSADFFGRDRLVAEIVRQIDKGGHLVALVGPSGSGKSSAVRAGLIPALRKGAIEGSDRWLVAQMVPGSHPFAELEAALLRSSLDAPQSLTEQFADHETGLLRAALRVLPDDRTRLLLVIDQFEELFTLVDDEQERARFLANLLTAIDDSHARVMVVLTLRADFYDRPLAYPEFGSRMGSGVVNVVPLAPDEFEAAAQGPARQAGVSFEPALLAALLTDVVGRPGGLPLFQYALTELFDRRVGDVLTLDSYAAIGGVGGALTKRAEDLYAQLDEAQRAAAGQLFLRLVTIAEGDEWGRRRVPASEIVSLDVDMVALQGVIELYAAHRLLTLDRDFVSGSPTVEVAHEALLTEWGRLREWIADGRDDVRRHASLTAAMDEWIEAARDADYLLSGSRLERYEEWAGAAKLQLNAEQRGFLDSSIEARDKAVQQEKQRLAAEARTARSAKRRLWGLGAAVIVLVAIGVVWAIAALGPGPTRVAMLLDEEFQNSIDDLMRSGLDRAEGELGVEVNLLTGNFSDFEAEYRRIAESGTDVIFVHFDISGNAWVKELVADYPDTAFAIVDSVFDLPEGAMMVDLSDEHGGFLAGVAAATQTKTGVVGLVEGLQFPSTEAWRAGFELGVGEVDNSIRIVANSVGAWNGFFNAEGGREAANALFDLGADVVFAVANDSNIGVLEAAQEQTAATGTHRWVIDVDSDKWLETPERLRPHLLTSATKGYDTAVFEAIRLYEAGLFEPGIVPLGLGEGAYALAPSGEYLSTEQWVQVEAATSRVATGAIDIPVIPEGETLPPRGRDVTDTARLVWDGTSCVYDGPQSFATGAVVGVEFVNQEHEMALGSLSSEKWVELIVSIRGRDSANVFALLQEVGEYEIGCQPADGTYEESFVLGARVTVTDPRV
ncbi:MAG: BTAD domain-containing putative transcriptional regulator [Acidimicrobiia bacterium]|nr:BTAD domain-containing putative transcriptional regulator [Acidimicrobiia bacterium]